MQKIQILKGKAYQYLGDLHKHTDDNAKAIEYYEKALAIVEIKKN